MFVAIGRGDLRVHQVLVAIQHMTEGSSPSKEALVQPEVTRVKSELRPTGIYIEGVGNLLTYLAKCCKPVPGDKIMGYVTVGKGISVHREDCQNFQERISLYPSRKAEVSWGKASARRYPVDISLLTHERADLLHELTALLANEHIPIISINTTQNKKNNTTAYHFTIEVDSLHPLSRILARVAQVPGVLSVRRE